METYLDIPTFFDNKFITFIQKINDFNKTKYKIKHVYGSISGLFSARESERLPENNYNMLRRHIEELEEINIKFFYALNASCLGSLNSCDVDFLKLHVSDLKKQGVENFIVAHPFLIELIKEVYPDKKPEIKTSVIMEIDDIKRTEYFINNHNTLINISTKANRDFQFLTQAKMYRKNLEILLNESCLYLCPFRNSHYTIESHRYSKGIYDNYPLNLCYKLMTNDEIVKSRFVLPEWIDIYKDYVKYFKISGRSFPREFIENTTYYYSIGKSPENILDLFPIVTGSIENEQGQIIETRIFKLSESEKKKFIQHFISNGYLCKNICPCNFCYKYSKKIKSGD